MLAVTGNTWLQAIIALSIFVPVAVVLALTWVFLRGKREDPDEQRWRRLEEERRAAAETSQQRE